MVRVIRHVLTDRFGSAWRRGLVAVLLAGGLHACSPSTPEVDDRAEPVPMPQSNPEHDASIRRGWAIAGQVCSQCHSISTTEERRPTISAPSFISVANRPGTTTASLTRWLTASHPTMPNYIFDQRSVDDLATYILSLAGQQAQTRSDSDVH